AEDGIRDFHVTGVQTCALPIYLASDRYSGYLARKQTHIHKLAIVLAAAQRNELEIRPEDLMTAERIMTSLEHDMAKVFESIGMRSEERRVGKGGSKR